MEPGLGAPHPKDTIMASPRSPGGGAHPTLPISPDSFTVMIIIVKKIHCALILFLDLCDHLCIDRL